MPTWSGRPKLTELFSSAGLWVAELYRHSCSSRIGSEWGFTSEIALLPHTMFSNRFVPIGTKDGRSCKMRKRTVMAGEEEMECVTATLSSDNSSSTAHGHTQSKSTAIKARTSTNNDWHVSFTHRTHSDLPASQRYPDEGRLDGWWQPHNYQTYSTAHRQGEWGQGTADGLVGQPNRLQSRLPVVAAEVPQSESADSEPHLRFNPITLVVVETPVHGCVGYPETKAKSGDDAADCGTHRNSGWSSEHGILSLGLVGTITLGG